MRQSSLDEKTEPGLNCTELQPDIIQKDVAVSIQINTNATKD